MRHFLSFSFVVVALAFLSPSVFAGGLGDVITITAADTDGDGQPNPVDHFQVRFKETIGFSIVPVSNPAHDPDSDGDIEITATANGTVGTITVDKFLTGQPTGDYKIEANAVDVNGNEGPWATVNFTYSAPEAPTITIGDASVTNSGLAPSQSPGSWLARLEQSVAC